MEPIHEAIYKMIKASALENGIVDMDCLFSTLYEEGVDIGFYYDTVSMLEQRGIVEVTEGAHLCLTQSGYRCSDCKGVVHGPWSEHEDDCLRRQREMAEARARTASLPKATGNDRRFYS